MWYKNRNSNDEMHNAWLQMEHLLDKEMPVDNLRNKLIPFVLVILGLIFGSAIWFYYSKSNPKNVNRSVVETSINSNLANEKIARAKLQTDEMTYESQIVENKIDRVSSTNEVQNIIKLPKIKTNKSTAYKAKNEIKEIKPNVKDQKEFVNEYFTHQNNPTNSGQHNNLSTKHLVNQKNKYHLNSTKYSIGYIEPKVELINNLSLNKLEVRRRTFRTPELHRANLPKSYAIQMEGNFGTNPNFNLTTFGAGLIFKYPIFKKWDFLAGLSYQNTANKNNSSSIFLNVADPVLDANSLLVWNNIHQLNFKTGLKYILSTRWSIEYTPGISYIFGGKANEYGYTSALNINIHEEENAADVNGFEYELLTQKQQSVSLSNLAYNRIQWNHMAAISFRIHPKLELGIYSKYNMTDLEKNSIIDYSSSKRERKWLIGTQFRYTI